MCILFGMLTELEHLSLAEMLQFNRRGAYISKEVI